jgi:tripartite-type tricarboxylate transporter receptor subunit TctC
MKVSLLALAAALAVSAPAAAQQYPSRPIQIISGNAAGGTPDILVRTFAEELRKEIKQNIVIVNRPGANGAIAVQTLRRAPADGHTLMFITMTTLVVNPHMQKDARYHGNEDFEPISRGVIQPLLFARSKNSGQFNSLKEVVDFAQKRPGELKISRQGYGASSHLIAAELISRNKLDVNLIGFTGSTEAYIALHKGDVQVAADLPQSMLPRVRNGEIIPLAITSQSRVKALPDVPTWIEQGVADRPLVAWYAFLAPKGTPKQIIEYLNVEMNKVLVSPKIRSPLEDVGGIVQPLNTKELRDYIKVEHERWGQIVKTANLRQDQ